MQNINFLASLCSRGDWFETPFVGNPKERFCRDEANIQPKKCTCVGLLNGLQREKTCLRGFENNTGTDQPTHPRYLISDFVIPFLESIICKLAKFNFLVSLCS